VAANLGTKKKSLFFLVSLQQNSAKKHPSQILLGLQKIHQKKNLCPVAVKVFL